MLSGIAAPLGDAPPTASRQFLHQFEERQDCQRPQIRDSIEDCPASLHNPLDHPGGDRLQGERIFPTRFSISAAFKRSMEIHSAEKSDS